MTELQKLVWDSLSSHKQAELKEEYNKYVELADKMICSADDERKVYNAKFKVAEFETMFGDAIKPPKIDKIFKNVPGDEIEFDATRKFDVDGTPHVTQRCITYGGNNLPHMVLNKALATLKIAAIIEHFFGGIVTNEEVEGFREVSVIKCPAAGKMFIAQANVDDDKLLMFRTKEQAKEFISYPENRRLVYDYCMINFQY